MVDANPAIKEVEALFSSSEPLVSGDGTHSSMEETTKATRPREQLSFVYGGGVDKLRKGVVDA